MCLRPVHTQEQGGEDDGQHPGVFQEQAAGHVDEVGRRQQTDDDQDDAECDDGGEHDDAGAFGKEGMAFLLEAVGLHHLRDQETDAHVIDEDGNQAVYEYHAEERDDPSHVPLRPHDALRRVFLGERGVHVADTVGCRLEKLYIVVTSVCENACLDFLVSLLCVGVERLQLMPVVFIVLDVFLIGIVALFQHTTDAYGKSKTDIAVGLHPCGKSEGVHRAEHVDERIIACNLLIALRDEVVERAGTVLEVLPQLRCLLACVGEVEDVVGFLRVEHQ